MIQEEKRELITQLIRQYKKETGKDAISGGKISEQFEIWRKDRKKNST